MATRGGGHKQFKHPNKPGRETIAGKPSDDLAKQAGLKDKNDALCGGDQKAEGTAPPTCPMCRDASPLGRYDRAIFPQSRHVKSNCLVQFVLHIFSW